MIKNKEISILMKQLTKDSFEEEVSPLKDINLLHVKFIYSEKATKGNRILRYGCRNVTHFRVFQDRILKLSR